MNNVSSFLWSRWHSFGHAIRGWLYVLRTQQNTWVHTVAAAVVAVLGWWLDLPPRDWAVVVLTIAMVFAAEFVNTAIEAVVDMASPEKHPLAKVGKDVGAAAVLIAAIAAVMIGVLILGPPLWEKLQGFF